MKSEPFSAFVANSWKTAKDIDQFGQVRGVFSHKEQDKTLSRETQALYRKKVQGFALFWYTASKDIYQNGFKLKIEQVAWLLVVERIFQD